MKKRFFTVIPDFEQVFLYKDMGMIPYQLQKNFEYESYIACYEKMEEPDDFKENAESIKFLQIEKKYKNKILDTLRFIRRNSSEIQVLNVYGLKIAEALLWSRAYKFWNKKGVVYLKLDIGYYNFDICKHDIWYKKWLKKTLLKKIDLVSAESEELAIEVGKLYDRNVLCIPNGFATFGEAESKKPNMRENTLLTVANLGTWPKATEILLEAFAKSITMHDWQLKLVGSIEVGFQTKIDEIFTKYPDAVDRIEFLGSIRNRSELANWYKKSKVFILPSRKEGSPLVLAEAIYNGCYIITTDKVASAKDITKDEKYGRIVKADHIEDLTDTIQWVCNQTWNWEELSDEIRVYALETFDWNKICSKLDENISKHLK